MFLVSYFLLNVGTSIRYLSHHALKKSLHEFHHTLKYTMTL